MEELHVADDQSHYEISLTAGQAFAAFVLLMLSLAAAFAFGLMIGKGQADDRLVVQKETPVVTEASLAAKKSEGRIVELGVEDDDFQEAGTTSVGDTAEHIPTETMSAVLEETAPADAPAIIETAPATPAAATPAAATPAPAPVATTGARVTTYAQLLSTSDQKTAEALAAKLIDGGFTAAYVERGANANGPIYRVRVKFSSEADARAAEPKLRQFSREVWITSR
ncbi:MAG TPA: SPOR domain-containing protein [Thermoanaerobaculia bacterium]|jgi:cell division protein FtsN